MGIDFIIISFVHWLAFVKLFSALHCYMYKEWMCSVVKYSTWCSSCRYKMKLCQKWMVCIECKLANRQIKLSNDDDSECRMQKHNKIRSHLEWPGFSFHHYMPLNAFVELIKLSIAVALDRTNRDQRKNRATSVTRQTLKMMQWIAAGDEPSKLNLFEIHFQPNEQTMKFQIKIINKKVYRHSTPQTDRSFSEWQLTGRARFLAQSFDFDSVLLFCIFKSFAI